VNEYLLYQIKKLDMGVYRSIFPTYEATRFGGGGSKREMVIFNNNYE
jgi:hypothetical protein